MSSFGTDTEVGQSAAFGKFSQQYSESNKPQRRPMATVDIAPHGDLVLEVDSPAGLARLRVASAVLCLASPVFRAMLGPDSNFKEACELRDSEASTEPCIVPLDDTDPRALAVILYAIHLRNDSVPQSISFANLYELAVICDKYDCATAVALWVPIWIKPWKDLALQPGYEKWLFIAWTFKNEDVFASLSKKIVLEGYYADANGPLLAAGGFPALDPDTPEVVFEEIIEKRRLTVKTILETTLSFLQRYYHPGKSPRCRHLVRSELCDMMILGSMIKAFQSLKIIPDSYGVVSEPDELWLRSITDLERSLRKIEIHFLQLARDKPCKPIHFNMSACLFHGAVTNCGDHKNCSFLPEFYIELDGLVSRIKGLSLHDFKSRKMQPRDFQGGVWESFQFMYI